MQNPVFGLYVPERRELYFSLGSQRMFDLPGDGGFNGKMVPGEPEDFDALEKVINGNGGLLRSEFSLRVSHCIAHDRF
jgi:hypothetical protein